MSRAALPSNLPLYSLLARFFVLAPVSRLPPLVRRALLLSRFSFYSFLRRICACLLSRTSQAHTNARADSNPLLPHALLSFTAHEPASFPSTRSGTVDTDKENTRASTASVEFPGDNYNVDFEYPGRKASLKDKVRKGSHDLKDSLDYIYHYNSTQAAKERAEAEKVKREKAEEKARQKEEKARQKEEAKEAKRLEKEARKASKSEAVQEAN